MVTGLAWRCGLQRVRLAVQQGHEAARGGALGLGGPGPVRDSRRVLAGEDSGRSERCWAPVEPDLVGSLVVEHLMERPTLGLHGPGVITGMAWLHE